MNHSSTKTNMTTTRDSSFRQASRRGLSLGSSAALLALGLALTGCSGGGGGGSDSFSIVGVSLAPNSQAWQINRPIRITFNQAVDFSSVDSNSINIREVNGGPAMGELSLEDSRTVVWQPRCPTLDDFSDAGLQSGFNNGAPYQYELNIIGGDKAAQFPVRAASGRALQASETRFFTTPTASPNEPQFLFVDDAVGAPKAVVRSVGSADINASYLEVGGSGGTRHYFERPLFGGNITLDPPLSVPLNMLGDTASQVALILQLNQSVDPRSSNIQAARVPWEFQDDAGGWNSLVTDVVLETNCTKTGSTVRVTPRGIMPPLTNLRAVITEEFKDLIGEKNLLPQNLFGPASTVAAPAPLADNYLEEFTTVDNDDATAPFAEPHAVWGGGGLAAAFSFAGTGGLDGDFDWRVQTGQTVIFSSVNQTIGGGPGFTVQKTQTVIGGVIDVRNLHIEPGGVLKLEGPNPITILASGDVTIEGEIIISGTNSKGVVSLNTTNIAEPGAQGQCGGGTGGTGSPLTTASSPSGGNGSGAFGGIDAGGGGGEACWSTSPKVDQRRGAGGGGGRFGPDVPDAGSVVPFEWDQSRIGMDAEPGFNNDDASTSGATSGTGLCLGGAVGPEPFFDKDPTNNFFGTMFVSGGGVVADQLVFGELKQPWAGAGGGGGGDANRPKGTSGTYPGDWGIGGDEKGSGGGGGGGSLQILALGDIIFKGTGKIFCRGGTGGGGENTLFLNRVGGGSGGGSGGHVILQSGATIDFSGLFDQVTLKPGVAILATGGQGGAGKADNGGATLNNAGIMKETPVKQDSCPELPVPQQSVPSGTCKSAISGTGGDGSPGIVQLHTSLGLVGDGTGGEDIIVWPGTTVADYSFPPPLCDKGSGPNQGDCYMVPTFGPLSRARSDWIALGEGGFDVNSPLYQQVQFDFGGVDPLNGGLVDVDANGFVDPQAAVLTWPNQSPAPTGYTFTQSAAAIVGGADQIYLDNPTLLRHFLLELREAGSMTNFLRFDVVSASYDSGTQMLTMNLDANGPPLESFAVGGGGTIDVQLQKAFFRISTNGVADFLPPEANVSIAFEATVASPLGGPETGAITVPLTSDIADLNFANNEDLRFIRFEVLFDISVTGQSTGLSPNSPIPVVEHLRMPFQY